MGEAAVGTRAGVESLGPEAHVVCIADVHSRLAGGGGTATEAVCSSRRRRRHHMTATAPVVASSWRAPGAAFDAAESCPLKRPYPLMVRRLLAPAKRTAGACSIPDMLMR